MVNINEEGLLLHGNFLAHIDSILQYGLVSMLHFDEDKRKAHCRFCLEQYPEELGKDNLPFQFFYSVIGGSYPIGKLTVDEFDLLQNQNGPDDYHFGLLIDLKKNLPTEGPSRAFFEHLIDGVDRLVRGERDDLGLWLDPTFYFLDICMPWNKFVALIVSDNPARKFLSANRSIVEDPSIDKSKVLNTLIQSMEERKQNSNRLPIYDVRGNVLYQP